MSGSILLTSEEHVQTEIGWLEPGIRDPLADADLATTAAHYGLSQAQLLLYCDEGLPRERGGLFNPFDVCNWLTWNRLEAVPALARRWRSYLAWFRPFIQGHDECRQIRWQRHHAVYLPEDCQRIQFALPALYDAPGQHVACDYLDQAQYLICGALPLWYGQRVAQRAGTVAYAGHADVRVTTQRRLSAKDPEHQQLVDLCRQVLQDFRYGYRRHRRNAQGLCLSANPGSCLDATLLLQEALSSQGWASTVVGGIIARDDLANPHFWLEVASSQGAVPLDISIPAIACMLGEELEPWLSAYVGGLDAGRITLSHGMSRLPWVLPHTFSWSIGEAMVEDMQGQHWNAWPCIDWVCGICQGSFTHTRTR